MTRRTRMIPRAGPALVVLLVLLALAPGALAQENEEDRAGREDEMPNTTDLEEGDPGYDASRGEEQPEEAVDTWFESPAGILVALVLAIVIVGLIVAMSVRR